MNKKYNQLTQEQRYKIECLAGLGFNQSEIADRVGCNKSTISRELKRNTAKRGLGAGSYRAEWAQTKADKREKEKKKHKRLTEKMLRYISVKLKQERWSPEIISVKGKEQFGAFVSHETIYKYIWLCKHSQKSKYKKDKELYKYLRHNKRYSKRSKRKQNRGKIPNRTSIEQRPWIVDERIRLGDMEVDLMMGSKHKAALIVIIDRCSLEVDLVKINSKKAQYISRAIIKKLKSKKSLLQTITFDNDMAFALHEKVEEQLNADTYFTRPYTSQDKGSVENRIGVIRRFFPKGMDMTKVHHSTIKAVERKLNNRPVRKFDYLTPTEKGNLLRLQIKDRF